METPEGYTPVVHGGIDIDELHFEAYEPISEDAENKIILRCYRDEELLKEKKIQMNHDNQFGLDIEDLTALEDATDFLADKYTVEKAEA